MSFKPENGAFAEKPVDAATPVYDPAAAGRDPENLSVEVTVNKLHQNLKGRHMQMIAMQVDRPEPRGAANRCL
jgi:amino acid transporter